MQKIHSRFHSQFKAKLESIRNYMNQITNPNSLISKKVRKKDFFSTYTTFSDFLWNLFQSSILYLMPCTFIIGKLNNSVEDIWWRCNNQKQIVMSSIWKEKQYINSCKLPKIFCEEIKNPSSEIIWPYCENGFPLSGNSNFFFNSNQKHSCSLSCFISNWGSLCVCLNFRSRIITVIHSSFKPVSWAWAPLVH